MIWVYSRLRLLYIEAVYIHTYLTSHLLYSHFIDFTPQYSHVSDFTPNFLRNSHNYGKKLLKLHMLLPFMDHKHTFMMVSLHSCISNYHM